MYARADSRWRLQRTSVRGRHTHGHHRCGHEASTRRTRLPSRVSDVSQDQSGLPAGDADNESARSR